MMTKLQEELKKRLAEKSMSVNALEKAAQLKPGAVQNIMRGRSTNPGMDLLLAIAGVLSCTVDELMGTEQKAVSAAPSTYTSAGEQLDWQAGLYLQVVKLLIEQLEKEAITINEAGALYYIKEVYDYCAPTGVIDQRFAVWTFQKMRERYGSGED